jgi:hypothetical protein
MSFPKKDHRCGQDIGEGQKDCGRTWRQRSIDAARWNQRMFLRIIRFRGFGVDWLDA